MTINYTRSPLPATLDEIITDLAESVGYFIDNAGPDDETMELATVEEWVVIHHDCDYDDLRVLFGETPLWETNVEVSVQVKHEPATYWEPSETYGHWYIRVEGCGEVSGDLTEVAYARDVIVSGLRGRA